MTNKYPEGQRPDLSSRERRSECESERTDPIQFIGNHGYDPVYGARPLKRAIQHLLLDPLSLDVLDGKFLDGDVITADVQQGRVEFHKE
jgi:ATP-dependent Clp protease ATP-binding subunit ClpA